MRRALSVVSLLAVSIAIGCSDGSGKTEPAASRPDSKSPPTASSDEPATGRVLGLPAGWELAPKATYAASQTPGEVIIKATGESPTAGYEVKLFQSPLRIWPPQWMLARKKPDGVVAQVNTPFEAAASFKASEPIKAVRVSDAAGPHEVTVDQARD